MRRTALVVLALVLAAFSARVFAQNPEPGDFVAGEILVKFRPGVAAAAQAEAHRQAGGTRQNEISQIRVQVVSVAAGDEIAAIARYRRNPNVEYAEPNFIRRIPAISAVLQAQVLPSDFYFEEQYSLHNTGQLFQCIPWIGGKLCFYIGTPDADIDAPEAWAISMGSSGVKVAVLDTGVDYTHPDLAANYAGGLDFATPDSDPADDHGHGSHVAGTIAAAINNPTGTPAAEEGIVGVAPNAHILAYKVCKSDGTCADSAIAQGIIQAITDGAKVINMSFGGPTRSETTDDAIQTAWAAGLVIAASAGNSGVDTPSFPASLPNVIAVGASDEDDLRAYFSNFGSWVDIAAPGNVIMSAQPMWTCGGGTIPGDIGCYTWMSGTSMAAPHVAGAAALVWSRPDVTTNSQVVNILLNSADPRGVSSVPINSWTAHGRLNIHSAMTYGSSNVAPTANAGPDQTLSDANNDGGELVSFDGRGSSDPEGDPLTYEWSEGSTVLAFGATPSIWLTVGAHTLTLEVTDDEGATGVDTVVVTVNAPPPPPPPNAPPVANAGLDQTVTDTNNDGTEPVALNGAASFDPEGGPLVYEWREGSTLLATGATPTIFLPVGVHTLTLEVTDDQSDTGTDTVVVTVSAPPPPPSLSVTGISPNVVSQNAGVVSFVVTGTGFASGASMVFVNGSGPTPRVVSVTWNSSTQLTALVEIKAGGPRRSRQWDVQVTNPGGASTVGAALLTITP